MAYKLYMTIALPGVIYGKEEAMDAAVKALQDAVTIDDSDEYADIWSHINTGAAIQCRVFEEQTITSGVDHVFLIDIHDGAI